MSRVIIYLLGAITAAGLIPQIRADEKNPNPVSKVPADHPERAKKGLALFKQSVRETLVKHCLDCHGGKSIKGDFDLSSREKLMGSGHVDQTAADSYLVLLISHAEEPHMPLKAPKLPQEKIDQIKQWIDYGAPYDKPLIDKVENAVPAAMQVTDKDREFWSFRPIHKSDPPRVKNEAWCRTSIDRFIVARHQEASLRPNGPADKRTLIRRAYFDLLGLPPTPEDVDAFVNSTDPEAWPKLIDKLLDSPHYGERWARHWMDVARFAESHGYEQDYDRKNAFHYRDFLIKAFNQDLPYDQFVQWQLAGDELEPENPLGLMATGFLGAGAFPTQLTEVEFESARYDELDDMVTTTGVAFLGLSIGCARCHDHKFDPIPARDYYSLAASFTTAIRSEIDLDLTPDENRRRQSEYNGRLAELSQAVCDFETNELPKKFREWLAKYDPQSMSLGAWELPTVTSVESSGGTKFALQNDGTYLATGNTPAKEVIAIVAETKSTDIRGIRLEALTHDSLPHKGPGRADNGNFALGDVKVTVAPLGAGSPSTAAPKLSAARATHEQNKDSLSVAASIDGDPVSGWAVDQGGIGKDQAAVFDLDQPVSHSTGTRLTLTLTFSHPNAKHTIGRFRLSLTNRPQAAAEVGNIGPNAAIIQALAALKVQVAEDSPHWKTAIAWFARTQPDWLTLNTAVEQHKAKGPGLALSKVMVTSEGFPHMPHHADDRGFPHFYPQTFFLKRGDVIQKQAEAQPGFLQVLMPSGCEPSTWHTDPPSGWTRTSFRRASLARWITDSQSGAGALAARVIVNRLWQHHFGRGIVSTPNDFGLQGDNPTHPELLDWLADDLIAHGWKLKRLHKLIMQSSVYLQSGEYDEQRAKIDRENILIWRRAPRRLEAEAIRDSMLAVGGQLDATQFGPGTLDQNMKRRSIYFFIKRSQLIPTMMLFDWPEHLVSIGRRQSTTIAPQALMFMNSPQGRSYAQAFASRLPTGSREDAIRMGYRLAFGRSPTEPEVAAAKRFLAGQESNYHESGKSDASQLALADLCQTLMSMNEFVYVD